MAEYTVYDYALYFLILLGILHLVSKYLFSRIKLDKGFLIFTSPYIIFGVCLRMLADVGIYERNPLWNITPGVYLVSFSIALIAIVLGLILESRFKIRYWIFPFLIGFIGATYTSYTLLAFVKAPWRILYPFFLASALTFGIYLSSFASKIFRKPENIAVIFAHMLDGSATFFGIDFYGFSEEHLLPDYLIGITGTAFIMIPLKIAVVLPALYLLEKWGEKDAQYFKFIFFILGIGPGLRNVMLPAMLV
jgi:uncharacterized membrane protein